MSTEALKDQHAYLNARVRYLRWHYYYGEPKMSDYEFDRLYRKLQVMEDEYDFLTTDETTKIAPARDDVPPNPYK